MSKTYAYKRVLQIVNTRACVCLFPTCSIQHLPVELVVNILSELDAPEIVLWQRVSKHFRNVVADSVTLQYKIECCIADVLEEPPDPTRNKQEQLDAIREWRRRWDTGDVEMVVAPGTESVTRAVVKRDYGFQNLTNILGHAFDAERGVLVTASFVGTGSPRVRLTATNISTQHVCSASGERNTFVLPVPADNPDADELNVDVQGTRVMVHGVYDHEAAGVGIGDSVECYWLYDWQSGDKLMRFWSDPLVPTHMASYAFFDEVCLVMTINDRGKGVIAIFDCYTSKLHNLPTLSVGALMDHALLLLSLPEPRGSILCSDKTHFRPRRESLPLNLLDSKFTPANSTPVMHIAFTATDQEFETSQHYQLLIPFNTLDTLISQHMPFSDDAWRTKPAKIAWEDWGEKTRLFAGLSGTDISPVSGSRFVSKERDPVTLQFKVVIYDFCDSRKMLHDLAQDTNDVEIVLDCSVVEDSKYFVDSEIETQAPYRRIKTDIVLSDHEEPTLTEDAIILFDKTIVPPFRSRVFCI